MFKFAELVRVINVEVKVAQDVDQLMLSILVGDHCKFHSNRVRIPGRVKIQRVQCASCGDMVPADVAKCGWDNLYKRNIHWCKACYYEMRHVPNSSDVFDLE